MQSPDHPIVIFDVVCNLCNGAVQFIIRRDPRARFRFAPSQTDAGARLLHEHGIPELGNDTIVVIRQGRAHVRTDALFEIVRELGGPWALFGVFRIIPGPARDFVYGLVSRTRYRLFGRKETCMIPTPELRARFLSD